VEGHIHLQPEPSKDPADPLNWSLMRRVTILILMSLYALITNISSAIISSALPNLVTAFATFSNHGPPTGLIAFGDLTHLIAVNLLALGVGNIWWVPLSDTYGRRPILLIAMAMLFGFSIWCAEAKSFNSLLAARFLQGVGGAAADTLAPDVVGRVFFVHQRGRAMSVYTTCLALGSLIGGTCGGYVATNAGWRWTMWLSAILAGVLLLFTIFFQPEVLFDREAALARERGAQPVAVGERAASSVEEKASGNPKVQMAESVHSGSHGYAPYTFARSLGFSKPRPGLLRRFWVPWLTLALPGCLMVMTHYAGLVGLIVTASSVGPSILAAPPFLWGANVGLINVAGIIGTILGGAYAYLTTDWLTKRAARHDKSGRAEPEERLPLIIPSLIIAVAGALAFGFCAQSSNPKAWIGLAFGMGMISFGLMQIPSVGFNYIVEAYGDWASNCCECFLPMLSPVTTIPNR
jgi:MFS family permease